MLDFQSRESDLRSICRTWLGPRAVELEQLDSGGFSGSAVIRVRGPGGDGGFVLKSFSAPTPRARIEWIHRLMRHLRAAGIAEVAEVMMTPGGDTIAVDATGRSWELVRFVAGSATDSPTLPQSQAAFHCLARVHVAAAAMSSSPLHWEVPAAVQRRVEHAQRLLATPWCGPLQGMPRELTPLQRAVWDLRDRAAEAFEAAAGTAAVQRVAAVRPRPLPVQAVLRDIWCDHVLYDPIYPDRVAGMIDLHAAAIDTPATDLARLVGSWRRALGTSLRARWGEALAAYELVQPLREGERSLVPWLHATGVVCGLDNWFRWSLAEAREFVRPGQALGRMQRLLDQVPECLDELNTAAPSGV